MKLIIIIFLIVMEILALMVTKSKRFLCNLDNLDIFPLKLFLLDELNR